MNNTVVQKPQEVDPRFEGHCSLETLVRPDHSRHIVRALRDTGALQSLVSQQSVSECDYESTGKSRLIRSVMCETMSVPLVRETLQSNLCSGSFLCGLATSLLSGIDVLLGNDLCPSLTPVDVAVATRSQSTVVHREAEMQTPVESDPGVSSVEVESDPADKSLEVGRASLFEGLVTAESFSPELLDRAELIRLQQSDPGLTPLFEQAEKGDKRYFVRSGVLLRTSRTKLALPHRSIY